MTRATIYARISRDTEGLGLGVQRQLDDCRKLAESLGLTVEVELVDNDISAYSGKPRPQYLELLELIRSGRTDAVVVYHADRLHRSTRELEDYISACEPRGVPTHTVRAGQLDLSTPAGRAVAKTVGAWSQYESEVKSDRIRRKKLELAERGMPSGSWRPFGYRDDQMTVDPVERDLVVEATRYLLEGGTVRGLTDQWRERGITSSQGTTFTMQGLRRMLLKPRNAGIRVYKGTEYPAVWEPLVPLAEFRALEKLLRDPARRTTPGNQPKHLGSTIYRCGTTLPDGTVCEHPMVSGRSGKDPVRLVYKCNRRDRLGIPHSTISRIIIDDYVTRMFLGTIDQVGTLTRSVEIETPSQTVEDLDNERKLTRSLYADGYLTQEEYVSDLTRIGLARKELEAAAVRDVERRTVTNLDRLSENPYDEWERMTLLERREQLQQYVSVIVLPSGGRPAPVEDRVKVTVDVSEWLDSAETESAEFRAWSEQNPREPGESLTDWMNRGPL